MPEPDPQSMIFHVCRRDEWTAGQDEGAYSGSAQDREDGFIHLSALNQLRASVAKHRAGQDDLVLLWVDPGALDRGSLKWEPSRGGNLFPHVYGSIPLSAVTRTDDIDLQDDGVHVFPPDLLEPS